MMLPAIAMPFFGFYAVANSVLWWFSALGNLDS